jgi:acetate kinase
LACCNSLHRSDAGESSEIQSTGSAVKRRMVCTNEELGIAERTRAVPATAGSRRPAIGRTVQQKQ